MVDVMEIEGFAFLKVVRSRKRSMNDSFRNEMKIKIVDVKRLKIEAKHYLIYLSLRKEPRSDPYTFSWTSSLLTFPALSKNFVGFFFSGIFSKVLIFKRSFII